MCYDNTKGLTLVLLQCKHHDEQTTIVHYKQNIGQFMYFIAI